MQKTVVKKVRLTATEAKRLAAIARRRGTTESEVLRDGLEREAIVEDRRRHLKGLKEFLTRPGPNREDWEWKE